MRTATPQAAAIAIITFLADRLNPSDAQHLRRQANNAVESMLSATRERALGTGVNLLANGSECSESGQCESKCCVWNPFANEVCDNARPWRHCLAGYSFVEGTRSSQCGVGSPDDHLKIISYNLYLIFLASDGISSLDERAAEISRWFRSPPGNEYDVVVLQEAWLSSDVVRDGMIAAGYCHYVYDDRGSKGSGMGIFSKFPIEDHDFRGFQNACDGADCFVDKGVIHARINKNGNNIHVFGTHTMFSTANHDVRRLQYDIMRDFVDEKDTTASLTILAGDFNEDKITTPEQYATMLTDLNAGEIPINPFSTPLSYNPVGNSLIDPDSPGAGSTQQALDFILYDKKSAVRPGDGSICQYLRPKDSAGNDLSDHYPVSCKILTE